VTVRPARPYSAAVEDYLRAIYKLEEAGRSVTTTGLAAAMGVAPASVTAMVKKLDEQGLVEHLAYRGTKLTDEGRRAALRLTRTHRLLEQYLAETLDIPLEAVHAEADRLEHTISELVGRAIDEALGRPTHDPHGHPIPSADLEPGLAVGRTIVDLAPGETANVRQVPDEDAELLHYLDGIGLVPGAAVELVAVGPFDGPVTVRTERGETALGRTTAGLVRVG
jgi:DtxR family transcriptional regulator, Mn-dependent transcriptional regulator